MDRTYIEYRVVGDPGHGFPPYDFTWSERDGVRNPADEAMAFLRAIWEKDGTPLEWKEGPVLFKRTVTHSDWEEVHAPRP